MLAGVALQDRVVGDRLLDRRFEVEGTCREQREVAEEPQAGLHREARREVESGTRGFHGPTLRCGRGGPEDPSGQEVVFTLRTSAARRPRETPFSAARSTALSTGRRGSAEMVQEISVPAWVATSLTSPE